MRGLFFLTLVGILACDGTISDPEFDVGPEFDGGPNFDGGPGFDGGPPPPPFDSAAPIPFDPLPTASALSKVKYILTGLAPTDEEFAMYDGAADADATEDALRGMIDGWMTTPEFEGQLKSMMQLLFQTNVDTLLLKDYAGVRRGGNPFRDFDRRGARISESILQAWPETVWNIVSSGGDFRETMNTDTYMLNVPMMMLLAYADANPRDDHGVRDESYIRTRFPGLHPAFTEDTGIPLAQSLDPGHANFMQFSYTRAWTGNNATQMACVERLAAGYTNRNDVPEVILGMLFGRPIAQCIIELNHFTAEDFEMRPVRIVPTSNVDERTLFFDMDELRATDTLRLGTEHYGFHGDIGFQGFWLTNDGNEHRVTANQAIVVALGKNFNPDSISSIADSSEPDEEHADPTTACWGCHRGLDPMRDFFRQSYTAFGSERIAGADNEPVPETAAFGVGLPSAVEGVGVERFANILFDHPDLASAWTQKVCRLANGFDCATDDAELMAASTAFVAEGYDFRVLLREVLVSNAVVFQERSATWDLAGSAGVGTAARSDMCLRLTLSLGVAVCDHARVVNIVAAAPDWVFPRGDRSPTLSNRPALFFSAATERGCQAIGERALGTTTMPTERPELISFLVHQVMGITPSDPRSGSLTTILDEHYEEVMEAEGGSATRARQDAFVLACESPTAVSRAL
ncbi:MAG: hypothetical protein ACI9KE_000014 [Polyangiales bacterium]|jgi:hypothetical protein